MSRIVSVLLATVLFFVFSASSAGQSLGELARKERERRDENKAQGVDAQEFAEIFEEEDEDSDAEEGEDDDSGDDKDDSRDSGPEEDRSRSSIGLDAALDDPESSTIQNESRDRKRREADFRGRYQAAKQNVIAAQKRKQSLEGIHVVEGMQYVDENGNTVIESLEHLRSLIQEAERDLLAASEAVKALEEEAHRQSYPKGWLR